MALERNSVDGQLEIASDLRKSVSFPHIESASASVPARLSPPTPSSRPSFPSTSPFDRRRKVRSRIWWITPSRSADSLVEGDVEEHRFPGRLGVGSRSMESLIEGEMWNADGRGSDILEIRGLMRQGTFGKGRGSQSPTSYCAQESTPPTSPLAASISHPAFAIDSPKEPAQTPTSILVPSVAVARRQRALSESSVSSIEPLRVSFVSTTNTEATITRPKGFPRSIQPATESMPRKSISYDQLSQMSRSEANALIAPVKRSPTKSRFERQLYPTLTTADLDPPTDEASSRHLPAVTISIPITPVPHSPATTPPPRPNRTLRPRAFSASTIFSKPSILTRSKPRLSSKSTEDLNRIKANEDVDPFANRIPASSPTLLRQSVRRFSISKPFHSLFHSKSKSNLKEVNVETVSHLPSPPPSPTHIHNVGDSEIGVVQSLPLSSGRSVRHRPRLSLSTFLRPMKHGKAKGKTSSSVYMNPNVGLEQKAASVPVLPSGAGVVEDDAVRSQSSPALVP
ncbi:hypothetical protein HK097_007641 [Rhizophlyctis rosea]|uniref:Uncharacterized protein n=1 Tax=Rhizophlyctis rosea TaxID=64517 RepID=A0AAD5SCV1_9FUNG|nr:hypothetical protein HK097_007641 [Rhizophlyctis rosea]